MELKFEDLWQSPHCSDIWGSKPNNDDLARTPLSTSAWIFSLNITNEVTNSAQLNPLASSSRTITLDFAYMIFHNPEIYFNLAGGVSERAGYS